MQYLGMNLGWNYISDSGELDTHKHNEFHMMHAQAKSLKICEFRASCSNPLESLPHLTVSLFHDITAGFEIKRVSFVSQCSEGRKRRLGEGVEEAGIF